MAVLDREINALIEGHLDPDAAGPENEELLKGIAFSLGYANLNAFLNDVLNVKHPVSLNTSRRRLEKNIDEFGGDKAWLEYHRK